MSEIDFLLADSDAIPVIEDVEAFLGRELVALWRHTGAYHKIVGYMAECYLAGIATTTAHAAFFAGFGTNPRLVPVHEAAAHYHLTDPLQLGPGDIDHLASFIEAADARRAEKVA